MKLTLYLLAFLFLSDILKAQNTVLSEPARQNTGRWSYSYHNEPYGPHSEKNFNLSQAELAILKQRMSEVADILQKAPVSFTGYDISAFGSLCCYDESCAHAGAIQMDINLKFYSLWYNGKGNITRYYGEPPELDCVLNSASPSQYSFMNYRETGYDKDVAYNLAVKKLNQIFICPELVRNIAPGITAYSDGTIIIAKPGAEYWSHVTFGEWFDLMEEYVRQEMVLNNVSPDDPATLLSILKKDKGFFSAEMLSQPSMSVAEFMNRFPGIGIPEISGVFPVFAPYMKVNNAYFNLSLPRTYVQVMVIYANTSVFSDKNACTGDDAASYACCSFPLKTDFKGLLKLISNQ